MRRRGAWRPDRGADPKRTRTLLMSSKLGSWRTQWLWASFSRFDRSRRSEQPAVNAPAQNTQLLVVFFLPSWAPVASPVRGVPSTAGFSPVATDARDFMLARWSSMLSGSSVGDPYLFFTPLRGLVPSYSWREAEEAKP